jgi:hypothetical protein
MPDCVPASMVDVHWLLVSLLLLVVVVTAKNVMFVQLVSIDLLQTVVVRLIISVVLVNLHLFVEVAVLVL